MKSKSPNFFQVITQSKTYLSMFYLLLSFPLGIIYFVFLVTGISLGVGLSITLLGIPVLFLTLLLWRVFGDFERELTKIMLGIDIPSKKRKLPKRFWGKIKKILSDSYTWKSMVYLFIKFPLGIISFVLIVVFISVSLSFVALPFAFHLWTIGVIQGTFMVGQYAFMQSYWFTILTGIVGVFLFFASLHAFNGLAYVSGLLTKVFLKKN